MKHSTHALVHFLRSFLNACLLSIALTFLLLVTSIATTGLALLT